MLTKRQLLELWKRYDFKPNKRLGQNFLIDKNVKDKIIKYINPEATDIILEIGAGFAELTVDLAMKAKKVAALEKDRRITRILKYEILKDKGDIEIVESDFLRYTFKEPFNKFVGNLPYYITTPIIEKLLGLKSIRLRQRRNFKAGKLRRISTEAQRELVRRSQTRKVFDVGGSNSAKVDKNLPEIYITVQREYADRILANSGTKDYSSLSCFIQQNMGIRKLMSIKRFCFFPVPKVDSVFLKLSYLETPKVRVKNEELLFKIIRGAFQQRRKMLLNSLSGKAIKGMDKNTLGSILEDAGIDKNARPEELSLEEFGKIADRMYNDSHETR